MSLDADREKLSALGQKSYKDQACWFLNAFWGKMEPQAENIWKYVHKLSDLDKPEGCAVDELNAHRFLESFHETLTVRELRQKLRDAECLKEGDRPKLVPLIWFLMFKFEVDWRKLVNAPQSSSKEVEEAQERLEQVQAAFRLAQQRAEEAAAALEESRKREEESKKAKAELEAALADVKREEDAYNAKTEDLKRKSEEGGMVSRNKAKNELAQHLAEDPLPLRKAKITAEAAVKRAEKAAKAAEEARQASENAKKAADDALDAASKALDEAQAFLEEAKARGGGGQGTLWWIDRELQEQRLFLPQSKGGVRRN